MSPKRQVMLLVIIFSVLGIGVSLGIIASGGGFSGSGPSVLDPPSEEDIYRVGENINDGTALTYDVEKATGPSSSLENARVTLAFDDDGENWQTTFRVRNGSAPAAGETKEGTVTLSKQLTVEGRVSDDFRPYFEPIQSSIMAVRDMDYGGGRTKYLVVGAPWDTIFFGSTSITVRVTSQETVQTQAGTFDAFVLSYKLGEDSKTSRIWIVKDLPLPVKAEVYDTEGGLQYKYELVEKEGV